MNKPIKQSLAMATAFVMALTFMVTMALGSFAAAYETGDGTESSEQKAKIAEEQAAQRKLYLEQQEAKRKEAAKTKLQETKLRVCQAREKAINNILARIAERGQKQLNLFTTIAERTQQFYADKGKVLSNYDELTADVNAKKAAAQTAVNTIKAASVSFKCDGSDPKGAAESFKTHLKSEIGALKAYRTSVKNLIVGVKSVQGTAAGNDSQTTTGGTN